MHTAMYGKACFLGADRVKLQEASTESMVPLGEF